MAKVRNVDKAILNVKRKLFAALNDKKMLEQIGKYSVRQMKLHARKGTPLQGNVQGKFPSGYPQELTQRARKSIAKYNRTHRTYGERNANLTITGQLINGISFKLKSAVAILSSRRTIMEFFVGGNRKPYKLKSGKRGKKTPQNTNNAALYSTLLDINQRFKILGLGPTQKKVIRNKIRRSLRRLLKSK